MNTLGIEKSLTVSQITDTFLFDMPDGMNECARDAGIAGDDLEVELKDFVIDYMEAQDNSLLMFILDWIDWEKVSAFFIDEYQDGQWESSDE